MPSSRKNKQSAGRGGFGDMCRERPGLVITIALVAFAISAMVSLLILKKPPEETDVGMIVEVLFA